MHTGNIITAGPSINEAGKALIMVHGRGANAKDILSLAKHLTVKDFALIAPEATNHTWYPYSFMVPPEQNEPWLSSALGVLERVLKGIIVQGIDSRHIYFLGFSQGACLTLEYAARNATKFGGIIAFSGGLIGDQLSPEKYKGDFGGTPIFIGASNPDFHIPIERVYATTNILKDMNASVEEKVYPNMGHTISHEEIKSANQWVFEKAMGR